MALPVIPITQPCPSVVLTMFLQYKGYGWSEKYPLLFPNGGSGVVPTRTDLMAAAQDGCARRMHLCGLGITMPWARLTTSDVPKTSLAVLSGPLAAVALTAESPIEKINNVNDSLFFRFETLSGRVKNWQLRGLRDSWVTDQDVTSSLVPAAPLTQADTYGGAAMPGPYTMAVAVKNFLLWQMFNSYIPKKIAPGLFNFQPFTAALFRNVSARETGVPFGRHRGRAHSRV